LEIIFRAIGPRKSPSFLQIHIFELPGEFSGWAWAGPGLGWAWLGLGPRKSPAFFQVHFFELTVGFPGWTCLAENQQPDVFELLCNSF
jgi:hypothetical protein